MALPSPIYTSGDFSTAVPCSAPVFIKPFPGVNIDYVLKQDFMRHHDSRAPEELGTAHDVHTDFILVEETEPVLDGGIERWTRVYAKIPDPFTQPTTINYMFPGFYPGRAVIENGVLLEGRPPFSKVVPAVIEYDFFEAEDIDEIEIIRAQHYGFRSSDTEDPYPEYIKTNILYPAGFIPNVDSDPPIEEYIDWMKGGAEEKMIVAQDSTVERWLGNIFMRKTIKIWPE